MHDLKNARNNAYQESGQTSDFAGETPAFPGSTSEFEINRHGISWLITAILLLCCACSHFEEPEPVFPDAQLDIVMVYVMGGTFLMGCTPEQKNDCDDKECPAHEVTLSDFYIGKYEVTQREWRLVMGTNIRGELKPATGMEAPLSGKKDDHPMYYVSWEDAQKFIERLNDKTGRNYRLPTEAEWEYAARGGNQSRGYRYSGGDNAGEVAWYGDNSRSMTHPVGTKKANELGIYDMSGNVNEWVSDWYGNYDGNPQMNPCGPVSGKYPYRVFRSGSWFNGAWYARASYRNAGSPRGRSGEMGFRLALGSEPHLCGSP